MLRVLFILFTALFASLLWDTSLLLPFKLLTVLVHEIWHGFIAMLGGARLEEIHIDLREGGETVLSQLYSKTFLYLTISAGYLGSAFTGGLLAHRGLTGISGERASLLIFSACLGYMSWLFTSPGSLAFFVGIGWCIFLLLASCGGKVFARYLLLFLGTLFVWYAFYDLLDFTIETKESDAAILASYMIQEEWVQGMTSDPKKLSAYISLVWSLLVLGMLAFFFSPILKGFEVSHVQTAEEKASF